MDEMMALGLLMLWVIAFFALFIQCGSVITDEVITDKVITDKVIADKAIADQVITDLVAHDECGRLRIRTVITDGHH